MWWWVKFCDEHAPVGIRDAYAAAAAAAAAADHAVSAEAVAEGDDDEEDDEEDGDKGDNLQKTMDWLIKL